MLISIIGKARAGKDVIGSYLLKELNKDLIGEVYNTVSFADPVKEHLIEIFGLSREQLYGNLKESEDKRYQKFEGCYWTPREFMQEYGQFMRTLDSEIWIRLLLKKISNISTNYIITDVRHINELEAVRKWGSLLLHVKRDTKDGVHGETHISETALDSYEVNSHFTINNDSSLECLCSKLDHIVRLIKKGDNKNGK